MSSASIFSRIEDTLMRYLRKFAKLTMIYSIDQGFDIFEVDEHRIAQAVLRALLRFYAYTQTVENRAVSLFNAIGKGVVALQASLEDAVSFASLYMNILFVVSILLMVIFAWSFKP